MKAEITSRDNPLVKRVAGLVKSRAERKKQGFFVAEGPVVLKEALESGANIDKVFYTDEGLIENICIPENVKLYSVTGPVMEKLSGVESPQGVLFTCALPRPGKLRGRKIIALENVSDPGNIGTIVRTAEAFGIDSLVFIGSCADVYSPKVVRAAMGAVLRVNMCFMGLDEFFEGAQNLSVPVLGAALTGSARPINEVSLVPSAVMIGNEARGLSKEALDKCEKHVIIPITGIQSLNAAVASSIFMYKMSEAK